VIHLDTYNNIYTLIINRRGIIEYLNDRLLSQLKKKLKYNLHVYSDHKFSTSNFLME